MGVAGETVAEQLLARGEGDRAIDTEAVAVTADRDLGVAALFEIFADGGLKFVADPLAKGVADIDMFA